MATCVKRLFGLVTGDWIICCTKGDRVEGDGQRQSWLKQVNSI